MRTATVAARIAGADHKASRPVRFVKEVSTSPLDPDVVIVDDNETESKKPKPSVPSLEAFHAAMAHLKVAGNKGHGGKGSTFRVTTAQRVSGTGSSNAFYGQVIVLQPTSTAVTEASNFAVLFDECRCTGVTLHFRVLGKGSFPLPTPGAAWALAYDPANSGAYVSVIGVLVAKKYMGPVAFTPNNDASTQAFTKTGYFSIKIKIPVPVAPTAGSPVVVGSAWLSTSDVTSVVGYVKYAIDALGASTLAETDTFIQYHMEYRQRT
jgi:hypothetical protein